MKRKKYNVLHLISKEESEWDISEKYIRIAQKVYRFLPRTFISLILERGVYYNCKSAMQKPEPPVLAYWEMRP